MTGGRKERSRREERNRLDSKKPTSRGSHPVQNTLHTCNHWSRHVHRRTDWHIGTQKAMHRDVHINRHWDACLQFLPAFCWLREGSKGQLFLCTSPSSTPICQPRWRHWLAHGSPA